MTTPSRTSRLAAAPTQARVAVAFLAVYFIWGSTYLAIRFAIETLPVFLMAGTRYLIAGAVAYAWGRQRDDGRPTPRSWRDALLLGALFFLGGNGAVVWAEKHVPSGLASLLVATMPLWVVVLDWLRPRGNRPTPLILVGLVLGFGGLVVLIPPGPGAVDPLGALVLVSGALSWAMGSIYARHAALPRSLLQASGMEMLAGGAWLTLAGLLSGEASALDAGGVSARSLLAFVYLVVFGSIVAFNAFSYLLEASTPAHVSTYAYVNPVVAVALGWLLAGEAVSPRTAAGAAIIVSSVAIVTAGQPASAVEAESIAETVEHAPAP